MFFALLLLGFSKKKEKIRIDKESRVIILWTNSNSRINKNVGILITYFFSDANLAIVENIVLIIAPAYRPIVTAFNRSFMNYNTEELIFFATKLLKFLVFDGLWVFDFLVILGLEAVEMDDKVVGQFLDSKLFEGKTKVLALLAPPRILFIKLFRFSEQLHAVV